jgi:hypothetical protein
MNGKKAKALRKLAGYHPKDERAMTVTNVRPLMRPTGKEDEKGLPVLEKYGDSYTVVYEKGSTAEKYSYLKKIYNSK